MAEENEPDWEAIAEEAFGSPGADRDRSGTSLVGPQTGATASWFDRHSDDLAAIGVLIASLTVAGIIGRRLSKTRTGRLYIAVVAIWVMAAVCARLIGDWGFEPNAWLVIYFGPPVVGGVGALLFRWAASAS